MTAGGERSIPVWVVDRDEIHRRVFGVVLERLGGFKVLGISDSADALVAHLLGGLPVPAVVIADVGGSGGDLAMRVAAVTGGVSRVLATTRDPSPDVAAGLLSAGASGVIHTPVRPTVLAAAVRAVAAGLVVAEPAPRPGDVASAAGGMPDTGLMAALAEELEAADTLASLLMRVMWGAAHEMGHMHAAASGYVDLALEASPGSPETREDLLTASRALVALASQLRQLGAVGRGARHQPGAGDLCAAADEGLRHHFGLADLRVRHDGPRLPVGIETGRMANVVWAAVRAVAAEATGTGIDVETRAVPSGRLADGGPRFGRIRVSAPAAPTASPADAFPRWQPPFVNSQLTADDLVWVMAGRHGSRVRIELWVPLCEGEP